MQNTLYLVTYDKAAEQHTLYATELCTTFATCNKNLAEQKLEKLRSAGITSADLTTLPFETDCDETLAVYYE